MTGTETRIFHTVFCPPGVDVASEQVQQGRVVAERRFKLQPGHLPHVSLQPSARFDISVPKGSTLGIVPERGIVGLPNRLEETRAFRVPGHTFTNVTVDSHLGEPYFEQHYVHLMGPICSDNRGGKQCLTSEDANDFVRLYWHDRNLHAAAKLPQMQPGPYFESAVQQQIQNYESVIPNEAVESEIPSVRAIPSAAEKKWMESSSPPGHPTQSTQSVNTPTSIRLASLRFGAVESKKV